MIRKLFMLAFAAALLAGGVFVYLLMQPPAAKPAPTATRSEEAAKTPTPVSTPAPEPVEAPSAARKGKPAPKKLTTDAPAPVVAPVESAPTTGTLKITADVPEASVFIDRKFVGMAPVTAGDIAPGSHHLNVSAKGYDAVSEEIEVTPGSRDIAVRLKDVRLSAMLKVKHKHGMGSCEGTLKATPQGITFETSNKDDAFTVALTDLDTFEIDYIGKNLKLKVKKGRTYNFTDPDGNADKLFVFHRDVDKVRQRLSENK